VEVAGGHVAIDGAAVPTQDEGDGRVEELLGRTHMLGTEYGPGRDFGPTGVPEGKYLVLGDNRGNSRDGRYFGWVDRDAILGKAVSVCVRGGRPVWNTL
jgi:signal peptidase I